MTIKEQVNNPGRGLPPTQTVIDSLEALERALQPPVLESGWSVPVVGAFSAGKTRLVNALIHNLLPDQDGEPHPLLPETSLEPQTLIPLEVTHGALPSLVEVERGPGKAEEEVCSLSRFPARDDFDYGPDSPQVRRRSLRMELPDSDLLVPKGVLGSSDMESIRRIKLIDMPGWDADEQDLLGATLSGKPLLATVYVVMEDRVCHANDIKVLGRLMNELRPGQEGYRCVHVGKPTLLIYIMCRTPSSVSRSMVEDLETHLAPMARENRFTNCFVERLCFKGWTAKDYDALHRSFWDRVWSCLEVKKPAEQDNRGMVIPEWCPDGPLKELLRQVDEARCKLSALEKFLKGEGVLGRMNITKLEGRSARNRGWEDRLKRAWREDIRKARAGTRHRDLSPGKAQRLTEDDPLHVWWNKVLVPTVSCGVDAVAHAEFSLQRRLELVQEAHERGESISDLHEFLSREVKEPFELARKQFTWTESLFPPALQMLIRAGKIDTSVVTTMVSITISQQVLHAAFSAG